MRWIFLVIPVCLVLIPSHGDACSAFVLSSGEDVLLAKNLDWPVGDGFVIENPSGIRRQSSPSETGTPFSWTSKFSSITFNQFGDGFPLGGMNETGLVVEELNFSPSRFPTSGDQVVNEFQWIQYQLDMSGSVANVLTTLKMIHIQPVLVGLHYLVADTSGAKAIIEFIDGEVLVYTGDDIVCPALTNNSYANSLKYLKHHKDFGGNRVETAGPESPERYVRIARRLKDIDPSRNSTPGEAFSILQSVQQRDTQWSIVYDLQRRQIHFQLRGRNKPQSLSFQDLDMKDPRQVILLTPDTPHSNAIDFDPSMSTALVDRVFKKLLKTGSISRTQSQHLKSIFSASE